MKKSNLKYIVLFFGIIIIADILGGLFYKRSFDTISYSFYGNINKSLKAEAEALILGSSRALHHYDPEIITNELKLTCYNTGTGGYGIFLDYAVLSERIRRQKAPKMVILDISPNTMIIGANSYSKLDKLLPYYKKYPSFKEVILLNTEFSKLKLFSNLYIYNSTSYDFIKNNAKAFNTNTNGFEAITEVFNEKRHTPFFLEPAEDLDENKVTYLNKIIELCQTNNIELIGVVSPTYIKFDKENRFIDKIETIFKTKNIRFFDYSDYSKIYGKNQYFKDQLHLNKLGAEVFSNELVTNIHKNIKNQYP